ncbi:ABC-type lipoprotein release transport system permease subunit [Chitinophaga polysaccharea]|uniref:ABC-type lipoprotein release transport system permease subunit n=1 Tax=Chitinophaga polysaccharea TaxID=1293035 RepID=A0A561PA11_9BACT|nr:FtsX-like permease family protein [Chitinophaga polysaccharea]TWF34971.1 ABC-type lipoprotein release transport system permease subunit [Chitinophaga polysaccharea]
MWLIKMAWKNMWRNRSRTAITMAAIFFAVILSVIASSLKDGIFSNLVKNVVSFYTGYIQIHKKGFWDEQTLDNSFKSSSKTVRLIRGNKNVTAVASRLESFALASSVNITKGCLVAGIEPEKENRITFLEKKVIQGSYLLDTDYAVLLSQGLAERLKLTTNDTVVLIGQGYHGATAAGKYLVKGIVKFGSPDLNSRTLFMPLATAQNFYNADSMITSYVLSLRNTNNLQGIRSQLGEPLGRDFEVMSWEEMMPEVKQHIQTDSSNMKYVQGILYLLICFGIFGTLLMMMVERKFEMGMLVSIGMKKSKLIILLLYESVFTVLVGCLLGITASIPLVYYLNRHPIKMGGETAKVYERFGFEAIFPTSTEVSIFIYQGIVVLIIGLLLSLYPMYKVIRLDPVTAMKR